MIEDKLSEKDYKKLALEQVRGATKFIKGKVELYIISKDSKFEYTWRYIVVKNQAYYQLKGKKPI